MSDLDDALKPFRDFTEAVMRILVREPRQSDFVLTGFPPEDDRADSLDCE